ncbi:hypothetical protein [Sphingobium yanoikuyae]|uniref:hypothetical protein n=1 Tax=Sphingobium yanoikuyae TaxID=13690 RepID=UPI0022DE0505|nr:hypothetical protein [Sphingobium yanoikuyae]WBQ15707.1 hypothetical protein PAE53_17520 [Sphingobium yanoikuyae]
MMSIGFLLASAVLSGAGTCDQIPGADAVLRDRAIRWFIVGEQHGTTEAPEIFADLACLAGNAGRKPVIAVELPADATETIREFLSTPDDRTARERLLAHAFWRGPMYDGRSSKAMLNLLERLRRLKQANIIADVIAFQPTIFATGEAYEKAMALNLERASAEGGFVLALVGNVHARLTQWQFSGKSYLPMAGHLPRRQTLSFDIGDNGGAQWACFVEPSAKSGTECGPRDHGPAEHQFSRGFVQNAGEGKPYSGYLNLGTPTTASGPAIIE